METRITKFLIASGNLCRCSLVRMTNTERNVTNTNGGNNKPLGRYSVGNKSNSLRNADHRNLLFRWIGYVRVKDGWLIRTDLKTIENKTYAKVESNMSEVNRNIGESWNYIFYRRTDGR